MTPARPFSVGRPAAETHYQQGNASYDRGALTDAVVSYRRALDLYPEFAEAHNNLGDALLALDQPEPALASFQRALRLNPGYAEAHGNMGNALTHLGRLEEAVASYRRMLDLNPHVAEAHNNLGNAYLALRQLEAAAASYRRALELSPGAAGALANLANALRDLGRPQEAVEICRRALEVTPGFAEAHRFLGNALFDLAQLDDAAGSYRQAIALDPHNAEVHTALSLVLRQMGHADEAEGFCRRALEIQPKSAEGLALLGEFEIGRGCFAAAEALFRRAIAVDSDSPEAWAGIARSRKMGDGDVTWLPEAQRIAAKPLPLGQEINIRFAIGKYFDDVHRFEEAFASYQRANELSKRYGVKHDRQRLTRRIDQIIGFYDEGWLQNAGEEATLSARPVFIVGMPRSGTTLTEQVLASHPAVFGAGELRFWHTAAASVGALARNGLPLAGALPRLSGDYLTLLEQYSADSLRVVDKMPANTMNLGLIQAALPNARIIHMQRNPIDTCLSIYFQVFSTAHAYANDLQDLAHYYTEYRRLMVHWQGTLPGDAILHVPYEGLVNDPESWSRKMVEFVGLPWDARCLDFDQTNRTVTTASSWQVRQKINKSAVERWRNYERFVGPLMPLLENP